MTDRLVDADHRHRFTNTAGLVSDIGTVGGRPAVVSGDPLQKFFETEFDNTDFADVPASSDFFNAGGGSDWSVFFKVRIIDNTIDAELWGGDSSTSAPVLKYDDVNERLIFEVNGTGGRQARWAFGAQPGKNIVYVGGIGYDRTGNILRASNLKSADGVDLTPTIDTTNAGLNAADGIRYGANASGNNNSAWRDAFYIIGEALTQTDLDDTVDEFLNEPEYNSSTSTTDASYSLFEASRYIQSKDNVYSDEIAAQVSSAVKFYSGSITEGAIVTIPPLAFNRKQSLFNMGYYENSNSQYVNRKYSAPDMQFYTFDKVFRPNRKYNELPVLLFTDVNQPPFINIQVADQSINQDAQLDLILPSDTFIDPESNPFTTSALSADGSALPTWLNYNPTIQRFTGIPTNNDIGTLYIKVNATDGFSAGTNMFFFLVVLNVNDPPIVANPIPDQNATANLAFNFQFAEDAFNDPDLITQITQLIELKIDETGNTIKISDTSGNGHHGTRVNPLGSGFTPTKASQITFDNPGSIRFNGSNGYIDCGFVPSLSGLINSFSGYCFYKTEILTGSSLIFGIATDLHNNGWQLSRQGVTLELSKNGVSAPQPSFTLLAGVWYLVGFRVEANGDVKFFAYGEDASIQIELVGNTGIQITPDAGDAFRVSAPAGGVQGDVDNVVVMDRILSDAEFNTLGGGALLTVPTPEAEALTFTATLTNGDPLPAWLAFDPTTRTFSGVPVDDNIGVIGVKVVAEDGN